MNPSRYSSRTVRRCRSGFHNPLAARSLSPYGPPYRRPPNSRSVGAAVLGTESFTTRRLWIGLTKGARDVAEEWTSLGRPG